MRPAPPLRSTDRAIREQRDAVRDAVLGHAVQDVVVLPDAQLDLNRRDLGDASGLFDLTDVHIAEANRLDVPVPFERRERADAGCERRSRIGGVQLVQVDALDAERPPARLAGCDEVSRPPVGCPPAVGPRESTFGGDSNARAIAGPGRDGASDQPLVVPDVVRIEAVGVGRVEEREAGIERRVQNAHRPRIIALAVGRQAHAANGKARAGRRYVGEPGHSRMVKKRKDAAPPRMASQPQRRCPGSSHHM